MSTYLITGASRGLGLELVKQALEKHTGKVIAGARNATENKELLALQKAHPNNLTLLPLDVTSTASVTAAAHQITASHPGGIDYLINNAGILGAPDKSNPDELEVYNTNVAGPFRVIQAFIPLVKKGNKKVVLNISSQMGSISQQDTINYGVKIMSPGTDYLNYRISKAGLNLLVAACAAEYKEDKIAFVSVHPGFVATDMALSIKGDKAIVASQAISPEISVNGILSVLHKVTLEGTAKFYNYDGTNIAW